METGLFREVIPGQDTVLLVLADPDRMSEALSVATELVTQMDGTVAVVPSGPELTVPVVYDGPDLPVLAGHLGVSISELIAEHCRLPWTVDFLGFAPGFPYLSGGSTVFTMPRLDVPRVRVPAGSVGVAAGQTCIYPSASPGGWNLIGRCELTLFDPADPVRPALLAAGDMVRFAPVPASLAGLP